MQQVKGNRGVDLSLTILLFFLSIECRKDVFIGVFFEQTSCFLIRVKLTPPHRGFLYVLCKNLLVFAYENL